MDPAVSLNSSECIKFYHLTENKIYIVGAITTPASDAKCMGTDETIQLFKFDVDTMIFKRYDISKDMKFIVPSADETHVTADMMTFVISSPVSNIVTCGDRGIVSVVEQSGRVSIFDMEDQEEAERNVHDMYEESYQYQND